MAMAKKAKKTTTSRKPRKGVIPPQLRGHQFTKGGKRPAAKKGVGKAKSA